MAQYRKDDVQARIVDAALRVFAGRGFRSATIAEIARTAGVSTGNVYRYYDGKDALFAAAVPDEVVRTLRRLVFQRVEALAGIDDLAALPADAPYLRIADELLAFSIEHRLQLVIVLGQGADTPYAGLAEDLVASLAGMAVAHFRGLRPGLVVTAAMRFDLELVYRHFLAALVAILGRFDDPAQIRQAVDAIARYHLAGLRALLA